MTLQQALPPVSVEKPMFRLASALAAFLLFTCGAGSTETWPPPMPDLALTVLPESAECVAGEECRYLIHVANEGSAGFEGTVKLFNRSTVPGVPSSPANCRKRDFNSFTCETALSLEPHATANFTLAVRLLATPRAEAEHCVSLISDGGDPVSANDSSCTTIRLALVPEQSACEAGQSLVNDKCYDLATFCTGGRSWDQAQQSCSCPGTRPVFDRAMGICAVSLAAVQCSGGRVDFDGGCYCPEGKPVWDRAASSCRAAAEPQAPAVTEAIAKPKVVVPAKLKPGASVMRAKKHVRRGGVQRGTKSKKLRPRAVRVAAASPPKCPTWWNRTRRGYCWPGWWISPDVFSPLPRQ